MKIQPPLPCKKKLPLLFGRSTDNEWSLKTIDRARPALADTLKL